MFTTAVILMCIAVLFVGVFGILSLLDYFTSLRIRDAINIPVFCVIIICTLLGAIFGLIAVC